MTTMQIDRATVEQALEALIKGCNINATEWHQAIYALRAALAQQDEPQGCATEEDCTKQPWCRIRGECQRKQAEPLNLSDPAVQKRLASQWGYVPAAQAEPVEPVAQFDLNTMPGQADAHLRALLRYTENFYATAIEHGMRAGPTANAIAHVERAGKALHQIVHAQAKMLEPARPVEPVEPVAWECKAGGLKPLTQRQYDAQTAATKRHYTRIAPPQRQPLTEGEIMHIGMTHQSLRQVARAVEWAHGIKEN